MALTLTIEDVQPFLPPLAPAQVGRVEAWLPVVELILDARYGDRITSERFPLFAYTAAEAIERRLKSPGGPIESQSIGGASVKYTAGASLTSWFTGAELAQLDQACGLGGNIRSVRTPAPDAIRFGNTSSVFEQVAESDGYYIEGD